MQVIAEAMATVHTQLQTAIEPSDGIVDANNGVFIIESGITVVGDADGVRPGLCGGAFEGIREEGPTAREGGISL